MAQDRRRDMRSFSSPVKVGDELTVKIEAVGEKGDGLAKKDGFVLFVPGTKQGEEVKVRVTRVLKKVGFAEVVGRESGEESSTEEGTSEPQSEERSQESSEGSDYEGEDSENFGEEDQ